MTDISKHVVFHIARYLQAGRYDFPAELLRALRDELDRAEARVAELEGVAIRTSASLAAAISLLERGGKAVKKAAASDKMFDQMLMDYRKSLNDARAALADKGGE